MSIQAGLRMVVFNGTTMNAIDPEDLCLDENELKEYLKKNKYPDDKEYPEKDFISDILDSSGFYSIPIRTKQETIDFIVDCLNELID